MRRALAAGLVTVLALAICGPAEAAKREVEMAFRIPAPPGQQIYVATHDRRVQMTVTVDGGPDAFAAALYEAQASVTRRRLRADIGPFGSIDMRFEPSGEPVRRGPCEIKVRRGTLTGRAAYFGEVGAAAAETTRVRGRVAIFREGCRGGRKRGEQPGDRREVALTAFASTRPPETPEVGFLAGHQPGLRGTALEAQRRSSEGGVRVRRLAAALGPKRALTYNRRLTSASVIAPPGPFAGTATFTRKESGTTWTGDLSVTLLGGEVVPLTGPGFDARLGHDSFLPSSPP